VWSRQAELAELEHTLRAAMGSALADAAGPVTVASAQRADHYAAAVLAGSLDRSSYRSVGSHLRGLVEAGTQHLVIDLSRVRRLDPTLADLLHRLEAWIGAHGGVLEVTGLTPRVLHDLGDDPVTRVFSLYRAAFESAAPNDLSWAAVRCPAGLDGVAEPRTPARHRTYIDTRARPVPVRAATWVTIVPRDQPRRPSPPPPRP
jgi:anti-anti-sigma regulatory factor